MFLGTQEEAAEAYDVAAIKFRGVNAVTNFDISRYHVEKIMASNTLLAGENARRNKDNDPRTEATNQNTTTVSSQINVEAVQAQNNIEKKESSEWKMALYNHPQQQQQQCDQKVVNIESHKNSAFSMTLQDLVGIDGSGQHILDDSNKIGTHFSNPSSLVTSLSSSREASPDKNGPSQSHLFLKPSIETKIVNPFASSWFPSPVSAQMRPASSINLSHLPVFAAWNDT